jgi:hypothetical protein
MTVQSEEPDTLTLDCAFARHGDCRMSDCSCQCHDEMRAKAHAQARSWSTSQS